MEHVGREQTETVLGQTWTFGRWERRVWADLVAFARKTLPNPIEEAAKHLDKMPQVVGEFLVRGALEKAASYLGFNSPEMQSLLNSIEGGSHLAYLLLKPHHPDITEDDAYHVFMALSQKPARAATPADPNPPSRMREIFDLTSGKAPAGNAEAPAA